MVTWFNLNYHTLNNVHTIINNYFDNRIIYIQYLKIISNYQDADIIVFPEDGLTSVNLPIKNELNENWATIIPLSYIPCNNSKLPVNEVLQKLSCAAIDANIYVVINIAEKSPCDKDQNCPTYKTFYYNSQVVFNRNGKIIARYRKFHLFAENEIFDSTKDAEIITFDTDFGVTFGTFICFDILFKEPSTTLTRVHNITDFVYSTAWFSELPFLTAIQVQNGWSYSEDVNLLAAGYNRAKFGNGGSGIYLGRSGFGVVNSPSFGNDFLIYKVPKKSRKLLTTTIIQNKEREKENNVIYHDELRRKKRQMDSIYNFDDRDNNDEDDIFRLYQDDMSVYKSIPLKSSMRETLCDEDFCCNFDVEMSNIDSTSVYKLVIFNGIRTFAQASISIGVQTCGIVLCRNQNISSCGIKLNSATNFTSIKINASFTKHKDLIIFPSSADTTLLPILDWSYQEYYDDEKLFIEASLTLSVKNLLTCGIYARKFEKDIFPKLSSKNISMELATIFCLVIISIFFIFLYRKGWKIPFRQNSSETEQYNQLQNK